jgi:hypothetical protein
MLEEHIMAILKESPKAKEERREETTDRNL